MKKVFFLFSMLLALVFSLIGCQQKDETGVCHIVGTMPNDSYNDKCIYLIAEDKQIRESVGIDSCFVKDGKFEFTTTKNMMQIIRMDYHFRFGLQDLLVVTEPGELRVTIDSISTAQGTVNNDSLQRWKEATEIYNVKYRRVMQLYYAANEAKDSAQAQPLLERSDSIRDGYKSFTRRMAANLNEGPLKEFLSKMFPEEIKN